MSPENFNLEKEIEEAREELTKTRKKLSNHITINQLASSLYVFDVPSYEMTDEKTVQLKKEIVELEKLISDLEKNQRLENLINMYEQSGDVIN